LVLIFQNAIALSLGATVEQLVLSGNRAISGVGNTRSNVIVGNRANNIIRGQAGNDFLNGLAGNDILVGGVGRDSLSGGVGRDNFVFSFPSEGVDLIRGFSKADDNVQVSGVGFGGNLTRNSAISSQQLVYGTSAQDSSDRFIYDPDTGRLFFDADGTGARAQIHFATFGAQPFLAASDIFVV
jgi:serralysin